MLAVSRNSTSSANLTLDLPTCLSGQVINALKADPRTVLLRPLAANFYALGSRVLELFEDEELADVLGDVGSHFLSHFSPVRFPLSPFPILMGSRP
jgi:GINS complex subunit 3